MEIETLHSVLPVTKKEMAESFLSAGYNMPALIKMMKNSDAWSKGELNTLILSKSEDEKVILTAIHKGTDIKSFQVNDSITIQVLEGILRFTTHDDSFILNEGQLLTIHEKIKYRLIAGEETVFLLTILNNNLTIT